jgi:signal transduction histidine kinase
MVQDTGIGIASEMLPLLFKIDANTSRKGTNGELSSGLGLLLCKEYVNRHKGSIWVESTVGEGSTFFIKLPGESA